MNKLARRPAKTARPATYLPLFRLFLIAYPPSFRAAFRDEMLAGFRALRQEAWRRGGRRAVLALWLRCCADTLRAAPAAWRFQQQQSPALLGGQPAATTDRRALSRLGLTAVHDLRAALQGLRSRPLIATLAALALTLGIGTSTAVFSAFDGLLLHPLPYDQPHRLVQLSETAPDLGTMDLAYPDFEDWRRQTQVFQSMAAFDDERFVLRHGAPPVRIEGARISAELFAVLGVEPLYGRDLRPADDRPNAPPIAVIGHTLWQRHFGADPGLLGREILLDDRPHTVIGIMPPGFRFPEVAELWIPVASDPRHGDREAYTFDAVARLKPTATLATAQAEATAIGRQLARTFPTTKGQLGATVYPLRLAYLGTTTTLVLLAFFSVALPILFLAATTAATLLLAQARTRQQEIIIRRTLGASRNAVRRQRLIEALLLVIPAASAGLALAMVAKQALATALPTTALTWGHGHVDGCVLGFVALLSMALALGCGLPAAFHATATKRDAHAATRQPRRRGHNYVVAAAIALSCVLLMGAGWAVKRLLTLVSTDSGIVAENRLLVRIGLPSGRAEDDAATDIRPYLSALTALPGVQTAAGVLSPPFLSTENETVFAVEEAIEEAAGSALPVAHINAVSRDYFAAMGIPFLSGRTFATADPAASGAVIISASLARSQWPGHDPIGKRLRLGALGARSPEVDATEPWREVIGVVGDVRHAGPTHTTHPGIYLPLQSVKARALTLVVHTEHHPRRWLGVVLERLARLEDDLIILQTTTVEAARSRTLHTTHLRTALLALLATAAVLLAASGIYGTVACLMAQQSHEIRIRRVLGAGRLRAVGPEIRPIVAATILGVGLGLAIVQVLALAVRRFGIAVNAGEPGIFLPTLLLLGMITGLAIYLPARRASDPKAALRPS